MSLKVLTVNINSIKSIKSIFKMLISIKIIKLHNNLICNITHSGFCLKLCFKIDKLPVRNLREIGNCEKFT